MCVYVSEGTNSRRKGGVGSHSARAPLERMWSSAGRAWCSVSTQAGLARPRVRPARRPRGAPSNSERKPASPSRSPCPPPREGCGCVREGRDCVMVAFEKAVCCWHSPFRTLRTSGARSSAPLDGRSAHQATRRTFPQSCHPPRARSKSSRHGRGRWATRYPGRRTWQRARRKERAY